MKHTIEINKGALAAVSLFSSKKDVRYYLQGVYVETGPKGAILVATNGHAMGILHVADDCEVSAGIIPAELIANALKISKGDKLSLTIDTDPPATGQPMYTLAGLHAQGIDGKYPEWRRVVPTDEPSGMAAQFESELVTRFGKAALLLGVKHTALNIAHNGAGNAARVTIKARPEFLGVMMPYRAVASADMPDWF